MSSSERSKEAMISSLDDDIKKRSITDIDHTVRPNVILAILRPLDQKRVEVRRMICGAIINDGLHIYLQ